METQRQRGKKQTYILEEIEDSEPYSNTIL